MESKLKEYKDYNSRVKVSEVHNDQNTDELSLETPIGWSSTCFNETINYYIDCNSSCSKNTPG
uniref:Uncharacterized protein n=1 Tax=Melanthalia intermedia TaxID=172989 RepID=A0A345UAM8_9FLOR|nr:hypothetical protein [Melanthalia intermedia]AXI97514.1 hypothetical protein [Melanthalia intermedia]